MTETRESTSSSNEVEVALVPETIEANSNPDEKPNSEKSPYSKFKTHFTVNLLLFATIPMGYLITANVFTSDFMPFMCVEKNEIEDLRKGRVSPAQRTNLLSDSSFDLPDSPYDFYEKKQHFIPNQYLLENNLQSEGRICSFFG